MLKLKLHYFGHQMWTANWLEKTLMLEKTEGKRRRRQRMGWLEGITDSMVMSLSKIQERVDRGAWCAAVLGLAQIWTWLSNRTTTSPDMVMLPLGGDRDLLWARRRKKHLGTITSGSVTKRQPVRRKQGSVPRNCYKVLQLSSLLLPGAALGQLSRNLKWSFKPCLSSRQWVPRWEAAVKALASFCLYGLASHPHWTVRGESGGPHLPPRVFQWLLTGCSDVCLSALINYMWHWIGLIHDKIPECGIKRKGSRKGGKARKMAREDSITLLPPQGFLQAALPIGPGQPNNAHICSTLHIKL